MDNVLRGGMPIRLGTKHAFYVYSRKHGDLERDYNYFSMSPEFYSQGNGNFRDVNQNRRCDTFFSDIPEADNIRLFYSLIQLDGYNPLKIEQKRYSLTEGASKEQKKLIKDLSLKEPFTPGELYGALLDKEMDAEKLFPEVMDATKEDVCGDFGEGYWSDHWTYNLDLVKEYLEIYPERAEELLLQMQLPSFDAKKKVLPYRKRYEETENGLRQYHFLENRENTCKEPSYAVDREGHQVNMSLMSKMLLMTAVKYTSLDAEGMGVEMDGGKPGWYDALNGLPGLFGSAMTETYELQRMVEFLLGFVKEREGTEEKVILPAETAQFLRSAADLAGEICAEREKIAHLQDENREELRSAAEFASWLSRNTLREKYRQQVYENLSGETGEFSFAKLKEILETLHLAIDGGIQNALKGRQIPPAYFTYEVPQYEKTGEGILPKAFTLREVPDFLEGPVRYLKLEQPVDHKKALYDRIRKSGLFDQDLSMYKVNASLQNASYELGRCRAFTPGWLENESIWLHMEYKYLLEVIRSGLYTEFFEDMKHCLVPFLDPEVYGRSTLENSSFIVSSANPDKRIHGKGFVARLSGSTVEFISMWKELFFGKNYFRVEEKEPVFEPAPAIPAFLLYEENGDYRVETTFRGNTKIVYETTDRRDLIPGSYRITEYELENKAGNVTVVKGSSIRGEMALAMRKGSLKQVTVKMTPN